MSCHLGPTLGAGEGGAAGCLPVCLFAFSLVFLGEVARLILLCQVYYARLLDGSRNVFLGRGIGYTSLFAWVLMCSRPCCVLCWCGRVMRDGVQFRESSF